MNIPRGMGVATAKLALGLLALAALAEPLRAEVTQGWKAYIERDYEAAARHWAVDAKRGDPNGAFGLAILAERAGDAEAASTWYEKAAQGGLASAQVLIGQRYAEGQGVTQSIVRAYAWYTRAMVSGVPNAERLRDRLGTGMSPDQIKEAEALAETLVSP